MHKNVSCYKKLYIYQHPVSEEDKNLASPFTAAPTASLTMEKEKQTQERAHPPGTSKILSKAREKAAQKEQDKTQVGIGHS